MFAMIIFAGSAVPSSAMPGRGGSLAHFVEFGVFGILLYRAFLLRQPGLRAAVLSVLVASLYGITDELHQLFVPGRMTDPLDWLADTAGAATAVALAFYLARSRVRSEDQ